MSFNLCIFCGSSSPKDEKMIKDIELLIDELLKKRDDLNLVYGGAKIGVMGVVAEKFLNDNRKVYGVMPSFLKKREVDHRSLSEFIETESMHERKQIMYDKSDAFLVLPGGFGTLDELFETACWSQLDQHRKPICVFNPRGFYKHLEAMINSMLDSGFISNDDKEIINIESNISNVYNSLV